MFGAIGDAIGDVVGGAAETLTGAVDTVTGGLGGDMLQAVAGEYSPLQALNFFDSLVAQAKEGEFDAGELLEVIDGPLGAAIGGPLGGVIGEKAGDLLGGIL